jgi:hypothetical protein
MARGGGTALPPQRYEASASASQEGRGLVGEPRVPLRQKPRGGTIWLNRITVTVSSGVTSRL